MTNRGEPLTLNGSHSPAAQAYKNIARRAAGEEVTLIDPAKIAGACGPRSAG